MDIEIINREEFERKVIEYRLKNKLVDNLINQLGSWEKFPPHLIQNLFENLGCKPLINKY